MVECLETRHIPCTGHLSIRSTICEELVIELITTFVVLELNPCKMTTAKELGTVTVRIDWVEVAGGVVICVPVKDKFFVISFANLALLVLKSHVMFL